MSAPTPTARQLVDAVLGRTIQTGTRFPPDTLAARVEATLALHSRVTSSGACAECLGEAPCATVQALNGKP